MTVENRDALIDAISLLASPDVNHRQVAVQKLHDYWSDSLVEYVWTAIKEESIAELQTQLVELICDHRRIRAYPRLIRFVENRYLLPSAIQFFVREFAHTIGVFYKGNLSNELHQQMEFALTVLGKSYERNIAAIHPFYRNVLMFAGSEISLKYVLAVPHKPEITKKIMWMALSIKKNPDIGIFIRQQFFRDPVMNQVILAYLADKYADPEEQSIAYWDKRLPPELFHAFKSLRLPSVENRLLAMEVVTYAHLHIAKRMPVTLPESIRSFIDLLRRHNLFFSFAISEKQSLHSLQQMYLQYNFPTDLRQYNYSHVYENSELDLHPHQQLLILLEKYQLLDKFALLHICDTTGVKKLFLKKLHTNILPNEINELLSDIIDYETTHQFLNNIEFKLLNVLQRHNLFSRAVATGSLNKNTLEQEFIEQNFPPAFGELYAQIKADDALWQYFSVYLRHFLLLDVLLSNISREKEFSTRNRYLELLGVALHSIIPLPLPGNYNFTDSKRTTNPPITLINDAIKVLVKQLLLGGPRELLEVAVEYINLLLDFVFAAADYEAYQQILQSIETDFPALEKYTIGASVKLLLDSLVHDYLPKIDMNMKLTKQNIVSITKMLLRYPTAEYFAENIDYVLQQSEVIIDEFLVYIQNNATLEQRGELTTSLQKLSQTDLPVIRTRAKYILSKLPNTD